LQYSAEKIGALLNWLDSDVQRAGEKYEAIRRRLTQFFALRQCVDPEELADETMERVARKASEIATSFHGEPSHYFYAVAREIVLEKQQQQLKGQLFLVSNVEKDDQLYECFGKCMLTLTPQDQELLRSYYNESKEAKMDARRQLANQLGVTTNALRLRLFRITMALRECVENCMKSHQRHE
jgi:DNA-directed RNA polymerase specialized sigma24 family protein